MRRRRSERRRAPNKGSPTRKAERIKEDRGTGKKEPKGISRRRAPTAQNQRRRSAPSSSRPLNHEGSFLGRRKLGGVPLHTYIRRDGGEMKGRRISDECNTHIRGGIRENDGRTRLH
ncbi:hypothetical protein MRX96_016248 [Rhipicephalus microplus]